MLAIHLPTYRPLTRCGMAELAAHQVVAAPSGGVLFARKKERGFKDEARYQILELLSVERFPNSMSILTMPGVDWKFENKLLGKREGNWAGEKRDGPARTRLTCIENDRSIYHAGITRMPGMRSDWRNRHNKASNPMISVQASTLFAERAVGNTWVDNYYFGNVDDLMHASPRKFDCAWLDYTGPMSVQRLALIREFFAACVSGILVVTVLKARWNREAVLAIEAAEGHAPWILGALPGKLLHHIDYQDGPSPMAQFAVQKDA